MLRAGIQKTSTCWIFADDVDVVGGTEAIDDSCPGAAKVVRAENVWLQIVEQRFLHRDVGRTSIELRGIDLADAPELRHLLRRHSRPRFSTITGHADHTIVGT